MIYLYAWMLVGMFLVLWAERSRVHVYGPPSKRRRRDPVLSVIVCDFLPCVAIAALWPYLVWQWLRERSGS